MPAFPSSLTASQSHPPSLSAEAARFFSTKRAGLFSLREDGTLHIKRLGADWKQLPTTASTDADIADYRAKFLAMVRRHSAWRSHIDDLPSMHQLEGWVAGCVCETPTGHEVEPDGTGPDGVPSWLRVLGLI